jgi:hypothetical protein
VLYEIVSIADHGVRFERVTGYCNPGFPHEAPERMLSVQLAQLILRPLVTPRPSLAVKAVHWYADGSD